MPPGPPTAGDCLRLRLPWHLLAIIPLVLSAWVYHPIRHVAFFADDLACLASIESDGMLRFLLRPTGGHTLLVRNAAFLVSWELFGLRADLFYWTVLLTHLLNVWLVFRVIRSLTASAALACFGAATWGTSPLAVGALGWYAVYGQVLVATILLFVLDRLAQLANARAPLPTPTAWLWYGLLLAGTACFGVGIGVAAVFPVVLFALSPDSWRRPGIRVAYLLLPALTLALYVGFHWLAAQLEPLRFEVTMHHHALLHGYMSIPAMLGHLLAFAAANALLGPLLPTPYPTPIASAAVGAFVAGLAFVLWRGDRRTRRVTIAMAALAVAAYASVAAGRGNVYAMFGIAASRAASVARYHYVGMVPFVVLLCLVLQQLARLPVLRRVPVPLALAVGLAPAAYCVHQGVAIPDHAWARAYLERTGDEITAEVRAHPAGTTAYLENGTTPPAVLGPAASRSFPGRAGVFVLLHRADQLEGRTVRFVDSDLEVVSFYEDRPESRLGRLLVGPDTGRQ